MYWHPGHQLNNGKYIIDSFLGRGAFCLTYKAVQNNILQLPVVIKIPDPTLQKDPAYSRYVKKFIQEVQILGKISREPHPNIVKIIDYFTEGENETPCLVMEFIAGKNLFQLIENQPEIIHSLAEQQVINYFYQIGKAVIELHNNSIIHRDIHPGNIMLNKGWHPILIDFGLAGDVEPASSFSKGFGNKYFAPYEQFRGSRETTVDIYGLAATLYYMVTGKTPTTSWDRKYHQAKLIAPKQHNPNISNQLNQAILKGMELETHDRPQSMKDWLNLLVKSEDNLIPDNLIPDDLIPDDLRSNNLVSDDLSSDDLSSEVGIDYTQLRSLLIAGKWKEADYETYLVMVQAVGGEKGDWIRDEELINFPCTDLRTIDRLWIKYSNGKFGFSVQKRIYLSVGGKADGKYYPEVWKKFGERIGWRVKEEWVYYDDITFDTSAPTGHIPLLVRGWVAPCRISYLTLRLVSCKI